MSLTQRVKQGFLRLPVVKKAILVSSLLLSISAVLPWYDNRNTFGVGETYIGIEGPLFLVGALVLSFGAISFFNMAFPLMGRNFFKLKKKSGVTAMLLGAQSLFLLVVANSVFFHPSFGTNVSHKGTRFGMLIAFASIAVMIISGWMTHRKEKAGKFDDIDDFMTNPTPANIEAEQSSYARPITTSPRPAQSLSQTPTHTEYSRPTPSPTRNEVPVQSNDSSRPAYGSGSGVDPLTLDPKTRYKMMRSQARYSSAAKKNLWGSGGGSAYSRPSTEQGNQNIDAGANEGTKIRMDL